MSIHFHMLFSHFCFFRKVRGSILALMSIISTAGVPLQLQWFGGGTYHGYGIPAFGYQNLGKLRRNTRFGRAQSNMSSWLRGKPGGSFCFTPWKLVPIIFENDCSEAAGTWFHWFHFMKPRHGVTATQITYSVAGFSELDLESTCSVWKQLHGSAPIYLYFIYMIFIIHITYIYIYYI